MYVYVYYVPSISCMCVWLGDCWLWYMCMISWMIRPPCEITHQLAVGTQNCFSTRFYTPYILTLNKRPECTKMHQCQTIKNISGEGHGPLLRPLSHWEGDTPSPDPTPRRSCSFSFTTRTLVSWRHDLVFHLICNTLLHYLVKVKNPKMLPNFHVERDI